jgi:hypothetical protein
MNHVGTEHARELIVAARTTSARRDPERRSRMILIWKSLHGGIASKHKRTSRESAAIAELPVPLEMSAVMLPPASIAAPV